ncbi:hypothetical protein COCNU_05G008250 [Cocos nucifera]|uniref:Uncharacterized protein n=1 Tax=Cocos nucifera TaxID=13894 RepID=A0A8K0N2B7_COCNU|nr:hypothetical protein COCNU_05G008250 [Cocos nucifera]
MAHSGEEWDFIDWDEPQETVLRDPLLDQCLKQNLEALRNSEVPKLKELLSKQTLFNAGISQIDPEGMYGSESTKSVGSEDLLEEKDGNYWWQVCRTQVELHPTSPTSKLQDPEFHTIDDFKIVQVPHDSGSPILEEGQRNLAECLFNKVILSLPSPDVSDFFSKEESIEATETFRTAPTRVQLTEVVETFKTVLTGA